VCGECLLNRLIVARGICHECVKREQHRQELYRLNHPAARILPFRPGPRRESSMITGTRV